MWIKPCKRWRSKSAPLPPRKPTTFSAALISNSTAWDAGIPSCEKAVALDPNDGLYHLWLGRIYGEKADRAGFLKAAGLAGKVRTEFERAVELSPNSWEARTDLAEFYLEAPGIVGGSKDEAPPRPRNSRH